MGGGGVSAYGGAVDVNVPCVSSIPILVRYCTLNSPSLPTPGVGLLSLLHLTALWRGTGAMGGREDGHRAQKDPATVLPGE